MKILYVVYININNYLSPMHFTLSGAKVKIIYSYANELYNIDIIFCVEYTHNSFILLVFRRPDECSVMSTYYKEEPQSMLMVVNKHYSHVYSNGEDSVNVSSQTPLVIIPRKPTTTRIQRQRMAGDIDCVIL